MTEGDGNGRSVVAGQTKSSYLNVTPAGNPVAACSKINGKLRLNSSETAKFVDKLTMSFCQ